MRLAIIGEGATEMTSFQLDEVDVPRTHFLKVVVARLLGLGEAAVEVVESARIRPHGYGQLTRRLHLYLKTALELGAQGAVVVIDRDRTEGHERLNALRDRRQRFIDKFRLHLPAALGLAVEMIEAWLLADEAALASALRVDAIPVGKEPEKLSNPKADLKRIVVQHVNQDAPRFGEMAVMVAREADLQRWSRRCRLGFAPFCDEVRRELADLLRPHDPET